MSQRGLLITGLEYFDSWTLVVSFRRREKLNKSLVTSLRNVMLWFLASQEGWERRAKSARAMLATLKLARVPSRNL